MSAPALKFFFFFLKNVDSKVSLKFSVSAKIAEFKIMLKGANVDYEGHYHVKSGNVCKTQIILGVFFIGYV